MKKRSIVCAVILAILVSICPGCGRQNGENAGKDSTIKQPATPDIAGTIVPPERYLPEQREIRWTRTSVSHENTHGIGEVDTVETGVVTRDVYGRKIGAVYRNDKLLGIESWNYDENGRLLSRAYREYGYVKSDLAKAPEERGVFANGYDLTTFRYDDLGRLVEETREYCYYGMFGSPGEVMLGVQSNLMTSPRLYVEYFYDGDTDKRIREKQYREYEGLGKLQTAEYVYGEGDIILESWDVNFVTDPVAEGADIRGQDEAVEVYITTERYDEQNRQGNRTGRFEYLYRSTILQDYAKLLENPYEYGDHPQIMDGGTGGTKRYDEKGRIVEEVTYGPRATETVRYAYDENGRRKRAEYLLRMSAEDEHSMIYDEWYAEPGIAGEITCHVLDATQTAKDYAVRMFTGQTPLDYEEQEVMFRSERYKDSEADRYTPEFDEQGRLRSVLIEKTVEGYDQLDVYDEYGFLVERKAWDEDGEFLHETLTLQY